MAIPVVIILLAVPDGITDGGTAANAFEGCLPQVVHWSVADREMDPLRIFRIRMTATIRDGNLCDGWGRSGHFARLDAGRDHFDAPYPSEDDMALRTLGET